MRVRYLFVLLLLVAIPLSAQDAPTVTLDWWEIENVNTEASGDVVKIATTERGVYMLDWDGDLGPHIFLISPDGEEVWELEVDNLWDAIAITAMPDGSLIVLTDSTLSRGMQALWHLMVDDEVLDAAGDPWPPAEPVVLNQIDIASYLEEYIFRHIFADADGNIHMFFEDTSGQVAQMQRITVTLDGEFSDPEPLPLERVGSRLAVTQGPDGQFYTLNYANGISIFDEDWNLIETGFAMDTIAEAIEATQLDMVVREDGSFVLIADRGESLMLVSEDGTELGRYTAEDFSEPGLTVMAFSQLEAMPEGGIVATTPWGLYGPPLVLQFSIDSD